jgi:hypothetical protein
VANPARRFPPPWSGEELDACYVVRDRGGQQLAYVYFEDEPGRRSAAKLLTTFIIWGSERVPRGTVRELDPTEIGSKS